MDISRYKELIKLENNNSLSDDMFWELVKYEATVESQIKYNRKEQYLLLIEKYINHQIDAYDFRSLVLMMEKENSAARFIICNDFQALETFQLANDRLKRKISYLINTISSLCSDFHHYVYDTEDEIAKSKIQFYSLMKNHYLKLQKLLDYEKLICRSFQMLRWILGSEILIIFLHIFIGN